MAFTITAGVSSGEPTYVINVEPGYWPNTTDKPYPVIITRSALDDLEQCDAASYYDLIHHSPELWAEEWDWEHPMGREGKPWTPGR